jgi:hypothetical protein
MSSPVTATFIANVSPVSTPASGATLEGFDYWLKDFRKYDAVLVSDPALRGIKEKLKSSSQIW